MLTRGEAELAGGAFGEEAAGDLERGAGPGGDGGEGEEAAEGEQARGLREADADAELAGGGAEDAAAEAGVEGAETFDLDGEADGAGGGGDGAAAAANGLTRKKDLGEDAAELGGPAGLVLAGEFGEVREGLVEGGIEVAELGQELVTEAVAGEGGVGVGVVVAPGLADGAEVGFDHVAADAEEGAEDAPRGFAGERDGEEGGDAAEALGPGAAKELHEDGLGLVVHGVGGEDDVGLAALEEAMEDLVTEVARGVFEAFAGGGGAGGYVDAVGVEGEVEVGAEVSDEGLVGVGLGAAEAVVDVDGGEADAEVGVRRGVGGVEGAEEGDGVCSAGDGGADAVAGADVGAVEGEVDRGWHGGFIVPFGGSRASETETARR